MEYTIFTRKSKTGLYSFPFMSSFRQWEIVSKKFDLEGEVIQDVLLSSPTLRIAKDDGVTDFYIRDGGKAKVRKGTDDSGATVVLKDDGLVASFEKTFGKLGWHIEQPTNPQTGKRLSRVFRLSIAYGDFTEVDCLIKRMPVDVAAWDGANLMARSLVARLTEKLPFGTRKFFAKCLRLEGTVQVNAEHYKGHFFVVPDDDPRLEGCLIGVPLGSHKKQIRFDGVYVDIRPVIGHEHLLADVQTIINHYSVLFNNDTLMQWLHEESVKFLDTVNGGDAEKRIGWLMNTIKNDDEFEKARAFPLFEYIWSGGHLDQSAFMYRSMCKTWLNRLHTFSGNYRLPIKGGFRVYIANGIVMGHDIQEKKCIVDFERATLYVSHLDWPSVVETLGGCDQDDAVNCVTDGRFVMATRNPNMRGEYKGFEILNPECLAAHGVEKIEIDWRKLKRITPISDRTYGTLESGEPPKDVKTYEAFASWLAEGVAKKLGTLGRHVNVLASYVLTKGDEPKIQPATPEAVIDGSVKDLNMDLNPVIQWDQIMAHKLAKEPLCNDAIRRLFGFLGETWTPVRAQNHWMDELHIRIEKHIEWFTEKMNHYAAYCTPPAPVYGCHSDAGLQLKRTYNEAIKIAVSGGDPTKQDFEEAALAAGEFLASLSEDEQKNAVLTAYAMSAFDHRDGVCWNECIADTMFVASREKETLADIWWNGHKVVHSEIEPQPRLDNVQVNGVWFNTMPKKPETMGAVPKAKRDALKATIAKHANALVGKVLTFKQENDRMLCYSESGKLLGFVAKGKEDAVLPFMRVVFADAHDGNLLLVLGEAS